MADFIGTTGDDTLKGGDGPDYFDLSQGGSDQTNGSYGDDVFYMGAAFDAGDHIGGGKGHDTMILDGDYSAGVVWSHTANFGIEVVRLIAGHDYNITMAPAHPRGLTFDASQLAEGDKAIIDGRAVGYYGMTFMRGAGFDDFRGGFSCGFDMGAGLQATDRIDGGQSARLFLDGDYSAGLVLEKDTLKNIPFIFLQPGHDYRLTLASNQGGRNFDVIAETGADNHVVLDGSPMRKELSAFGGDGADTLIGGKSADSLNANGGDDKLVGGAGADNLAGGDGADRFFYLAVKDSTAGASDLITDLTDADVIYLKPIDADVTHKGQQAFHLVTTFSGHVGELTVGFDASADLTTIAGDVDGDGAADLVIHASGDHHDFTNFVL